MVAEIKARLVLDQSMGGVSNFSSGGSKGNSSGMGGVLAGGLAGGLAGALATGLGVVIKPLMDILTNGFSGTIKMFGKMIKLLSLILKPLDMMLMTIFMPLFQILKPFIRLFNNLFRPFIRAANITMRTGMEKLKEGDAAGATEAFGMAFITLMKPLFDWIMLGFQNMLTIGIDVVEFVLTPFAAGLGKIIELIGGDGNEFFAQFLTSFDNLRTGIGTIFQEVSDEMNTILFEKLKEISPAFSDELDVLKEKGTDAFGEISETIGTFHNDIVSPLLIDLAGIFGLDTTKITTLYNNLKTVNLVVGDLGTELNSNDGLNYELNTSKGLIGDLAIALKSLSAPIEMIRKAVDTIRNNSGRVGLAIATGGTSEIVRYGYNEVKKQLNNSTY